MHNIILGFDFGLRRIGVAIGQKITNSANPLAILLAQNGVPEWREIKNLIDEWGADALVVGLPFNMDKSEQPLTNRAREFGYELEKRFKLPVFFTDERLTTVAAKSQMHQERTGSGRFEKADSMAAKLIVESFMQSQ